MKKLSLIALSLIIFSQYTYAVGYCDKSPITKRRCQNSQRWCAKHVGKCHIPTETYCKQHPNICDIAG